MLIDVTGKLLLDTRVEYWCRMPYPGHPHGCPNYNQRSLCPPNAPQVGDFFDLEKPHRFLIIEFNLGEHVLKMQIRHPNWTYRRLKCLLYWQGHVRKMLYEHINSIRKADKRIVYTLLPEAMGVNVFKTLRRLGIPFEAKPKTKVLKIALLGYQNPHWL